MADLATTDDVEQLWRVLTDDELPRVEAMLRYASSIVRARFPTIDARLRSCQIDRQLVADVVASMVVRASRNPSGLQQETIGPVSYSVNANVASGYLTLTADEAALLSVPGSAGAPGGGSGSGGVGTMRLRAAL
jgi:hypothetical protein